VKRELRLSTIRELIGSRRIAHQEELLELLKRRGFDVTQATLSRDLKGLNIGRLPDGRGGYIYGYNDGNSKAGSEDDLVHDFMRGFISIEFSGALAVVRTLPGHAGSVAFGLDNLGLKSILGTLAGDDTILVVPRDGVDRDGLLKELESRVPGVKETES